MGGAGSPLRHGCLSGKATLPASSGRLDAALLFMTWGLESSVHVFLPCAWL